MLLISVEPSLITVSTAIPSDTFSEKLTSSRRLKKMSPVPKITIK
jgi:hypothetical protein